MNTYLADALPVILTALAAPVTYYLVQMLTVLMAKFGLQATAQDKANMEAEIRTAIGAGIATVPSIITDGVITRAAMRDVLLAATAYMHQRFPDRVAQIIDGTHDDTTPNAAVQQVIAARLPKVIQETLPAPGLGAAVQAAATSAAPTLPTLG